MSASKTMEFGTQGLTNTAWAFSSLAKSDEPLLSSIAAEAIRKIHSSWSDGSMRIEELATDTNGLTWALCTANVLSSSLSSSLRDLMINLGRAKDQEMRTSRPEPTKIDVPSIEDHPGDAPHLCDELSDMCVVMKPAGWEVDNQDAGGGPWLSSWLMQTFDIDSVPICHYEEHQFGMLNRLDIPSSGLVLVGKTWEGFYSLKWQLQTGGITKDYVMLVHGWVALDNRINEQSFSENAESGAAAPAQLKVLAHLDRADDEEEERKKFSLVVMRFRRSRRTEVRTHFAGAGHPTVADGKYSERETYLRDREWCARKFMHSYRLSYCDSGEAEHVCTSPLPHDLRESLAKLEPRGPESASAVGPWIAGEDPKPFSECDGLQNEGD